MAREWRGPGWRPRQGHCPAIGGRTTGLKAGRRAEGSPSCLGPAHRRRSSVLLLDRP